MRKLFEIGGIIAGVVLMAFGVAAISMGIDGRTTVRDSLKQEQIVFGAADDPAVAKFASQWAEKPLQTGAQARAFAQIMHEHALESSDGLAYAQMGRFVSAADPQNPAGTSDETAALKDEKGNPVSNAARNTWVTATALSTALNVSYMAEQMALFGIVVGIALLLSGFGFIILTRRRTHRRRELAPAKGQKTAGLSSPRPRSTDLSLVPPSRGRLRPPSAFLQEGETAMASPTHHRPAPVETESGVFAKVAALLLGILVAVLGFFALMMWADARESRDAAASLPPSAAGRASTTTWRCR